jgi:alpha/beta superfamily hydrolase
VIVGDQDQYAPVDALRKTLDGVDRTTLIVLRGVDHFFMTGLAEISREIRNWL